MFCKCTHVTLLLLLLNSVQLSHGKWRYRREDNYAFFWFFKKLIFVMHLKPQVVQAKHHLPSLFVSKGFWHSVSQSKEIPVPFLEKKIPNENAIKMASAPRHHLPVQPPRTILWTVCLFQQNFFSQFLSTNREFSKRGNKTRQMYRIFWNDDVIATSTSFDFHLQGNDHNLNITHRTFGVSIPLLPFPVKIAQLATSVAN